MNLRASTGGAFYVPLASVRDGSWRVARGLASEEKIYECGLKKIYTLRERASVILVGRFLATWSRAVASKAS